MKQSSAFRAANLLYLIVLCLMVGNILLAWLPHYVRLAINEILFVFVPGLIYLLATRQPVAKRVRWCWPGWKIALLALAVGVGLYPFSAFSAGVLMGWLGYTSFISAPDAIPTTALMGVLALLSYAVLAPLCEEFLFRGIIQPVYETRGARWAALWVGLLFVAFHLSLLQGLSILLLALALGYVNYRTRSLPASIVTHFGANGLAALVVTQQVFPTGIQTWITSLPVLIGGLALAGAALVGLTRLMSPLAIAPGPSEPVPADLAPLHDGRARLAVTWPLLTALALYLPMIGMEWIYSRSPGVIAVQSAAGPALTVAQSPWSEPYTWHYEIRNVADDVVGEGECRLAPSGDEVTITCDSTVRAYEVKQGESTYASSGGRRIDVLRWQRLGSAILSGSIELDLHGGFGSQADYQPGSDRIEVRYQERGKEQVRLDLPFSQTALAQDPTLPVAVDNLWPWQLTGLRFRLPRAHSQPGWSPLATVTRRGTQTFAVYSW